MFNDICPIWNTPAYISNETSEELKVFSPRAGGKYKISISSAEDWISVNNNFPGFPDYHNNSIRAKVTTWMIKQNYMGTEPVVGSFMKYKEMNLYFSPINERINNLLKLINKHCEDKGAIPWDENGLNLAKAHAECRTEYDWKMIISYLIEQKKYLRELRENEYQLTVQGLERLESLETNSNSSQAFIAMWFDDSMKLIYETAIKPAIEETGYNPMRIDKKYHNNKIDDEVISEIKKSKFLVVDFSQGEDGARGNVYYEAGFAKGLNVPVIFTCRKEDQDKLHFDIRQFNQIIWEDEDDLKKQLINRIGATIDSPK